MAQNPTDPTPPIRPRPAVPPGGAAAQSPDPVIGPRHPVSQPEPAGPHGASWRVPDGPLIVKLVATFGFVVVALLFARDPAGLALAAVAAVAIGLYALRDIIAPVRLAADTEGVTVVTGFATRTRIPWRQIERIRIDERRRLGIRAPLVEIDTGETIHLIGPSELGAPVEDVVDTLRHLRTGR